MSTVSIMACPDYNYEKVRSAVTQALDHLGGIKSLISAGNRVLLKPNLLTAGTPEQAITTHPMVLKVLVELVREAGGKPVIGDSPGGFKWQLEHIWETTGMAVLSRELDVELVRFEKSGVVKKEYNGQTYYLAKPVLEADVVINVPKLKTHMLTMYTGAIKNMYGSVPGFRKKNLHKEHPYPDEFGRIVADIYALTRPALTVMDAITGMDGDGPATRGRPRELGYIFAGTDAVALDTVAGTFMGYDPRKIATTRLAAQQGQGEGDLGKIGIVGEDLGRISRKDLAKVSNYKFYLIPRFLIRLAQKFFWFRPQIDHTKCTKCHTCVESCPAKAVSPEDRSFNYTKCINCMCCLEVCPEGAVWLERSWIAKRM